MYRAGGPADASLPWSRTSIKGWTTALTVVSALAIAFPLVMVVAATGTLWPAGLGVGTILLFIETVAVPLLLATAGAMVVRGRRVPLGAQLAFALFPFVTALVFAFFPLYAAIRSSFAPLRLQGLFASAEALVVHGACASAAACVVLAVAMGGAVATVDRRRLDVLPRSPWTVFSAGSAWFVLAFVVRAANASAFGTAFVAVSLFVPLAATGLAALMAWCAGIFGRTGDAKERRAAFTWLVIGGLASGGAALLVDRASSAAVMFEMTHTVQTVNDPVAALLELKSAQTTQLIALALDIAGVATVFGLAARAAWQAVPTADRRNEMVRSRNLGVAGSTVLGVWLLVVIAALVGSVSRSVAAKTAEVASVAPGDLELPTPRADFRTQFFIPSEAFALHADGRVGKLVSRDAVREYGYTWPNVYADRRTPFSLLVTAIQWQRLPMQFHLISRRDVPLTGPNGRDALGDLAAFLPRPELATAVSFTNGGPVGSAIIARLDDPPAVRLEWYGKERIVSLGGDETADARAAAFEEIVGGPSMIITVRLLPRGNDTVERLLSVVQALAGRKVEISYDMPTSSGRGSAGSASSPRYR